MMFKDYHWLCMQGGLSWKGPGTIWGTVLFYVLQSDWPLLTRTPTQDSFFEEMGDTPGSALWGERRFISGEPFSVRV